MKYILILVVVVLLVGCKNGIVKPNIIKCDTTILSREYVLQHDTLVILLTRDSVPMPPHDSNIWMLPGGWSQGKINMFENGKTIDTIRRHEIIYY